MRATISSSHVSKPFKMNTFNALHEIINDYRSEEMAKSRMGFVRIIWISNERFGCWKIFLMMTSFGVVCVSLSLSRLFFLCISLATVIIHDFGTE